MKKVKVVTVPVTGLLDMIEEATARGMQRGAQIVLQELQADKQPPQPKADADIFLGGATDG